MKRFFEIITIILFFAVISMFGISAIFFGAIPDLKNILQGKYLTGEIKEQFSESFPLKENFRTLYALTAQLLGEREFSDVYYDKENGRLIEIVSQPDEKKIRENISEINEFHESYPDAAAYIMIVPTASGIYSGELPSSVGAADQQTVIDEIYYSADADITPLDCYAALYSARENYIYYYTEPYWTQLGAYEAYRSVIAKLGFDPYTISNYDLEYTHADFYGTLSEKNRITPDKSDTIDAFRCKYGSYIKSLEILCDNKLQESSVYSAAALNSSSKYSYFLGSDRFTSAEIETTNEDSPSILIIGSDYANCFIPFLAPHYSRITLIDTSDLGEGETIEDFSDPDDYDQILFLYDLKTFTGQL